MNMPTDKSEGNSKNLYHVTLFSLFRFRTRNRHVGLDASLALDYVVDEEMKPFNTHHDLM